MNKEQADAIRYRHATRGATPRVAPVAGRRGPLRVTPEAAAQMRAIKGVRDAASRARTDYNATLTAAGQGYPGAARLDVAKLASALTRSAEDWALANPDEPTDRNPGVRAIRTTYATLSHKIIELDDYRMWTHS